MMEPLKSLIPELTDTLRNGILPFWIGLEDRARGGFFGRVDGTGVLHPDAPKGVVMHARILWTFSAACRLFGDPAYRAAAEAAKASLLGNFCDQEYGGVYWTISADGRPLETKKQFYGLSFAIYGLSEYYRATGDREALDAAVRLYGEIEHHAFDPQYDGYFEASDRTWNLLDDMRLSDKDANEKKTMNTHLHILEAYTNLYRVWPDPDLRRQLANLLRLFLRRLLSPSTNHLGLFFGERWEDRSEGVYSYGHDIEASWLLFEAAEVIGDPALMQEVLSRTAALGRAALEGYMSDGSMAYEGNAEGITDRERHWWVQAETMVGLYYLSAFHGEERAAAMLLDTWDYIKSHLIDRESGEWFWSIRADGGVNLDDDKAGIWKCPYHNGRMCLELLERLGGVPERK